MKKTRVAKIRFNCRTLVKELTLTVILNKINPVYYLKSNLFSVLMSLVNERITVSKA